MADLNTLEEKLGEVTGPAAAAQDATRKVEGLLDDEERHLEEVRAGSLRLAAVEDPYEA
jgi:hypothetical protein